MGYLPVNGYSERHDAIGARGLPELESISVRAVAAKEKSAVILQVLRQTARESRTRKSQPFYSIRAVANHFGVPPTTVARIYGTLKDEGLLASAWGSKTFVEPTQIDKEVRFRAVIGLPALLKSFCAVPAYRAFFLNIRDVLWRLGFATRLLFYEGHDAEEATFPDLFVTYKIDFVIWFLPNRKSRNTAARIIDRGIRLITVIDSSTSSSGSHYHLSRQRALKEGLMAWRREGITSVTVLHPAFYESIDQLAMIQTCLREVAIPYTIANIDSCEHKYHFRAVLLQKNRGIIFPSSEIVVQLGSKNSTHVGKLFEQSRVMLFEGLVDLPQCTPCDAPIDFIEFDWPTVARQIGRDLVGAASLATKAPITFEAKWLRGRGMNGS